MGDDNQQINNSWPRAPYNWVLNSMKNIIFFNFTPQQEQHY